MSEGARGTRTAVIGCVLALSAALCSAGEVTVVKPEESNELLANPHMGWETFGQCAAWDKALQGLPTSTEYIRWYWADVEPQKGQIDWKKLDGEVARARQSGQRLAFRIMVYGTGREERFSPEWLRKDGYAGFEYNYGRGQDRTYWGPDLDDPAVLERQLWLIRELGKHFDASPDIDNVDIGTVGLWGEWHMSDTGRGNPSPATCRKIIDTYSEAFPHTPLLMQIGPVEELRYAVSRGAGWRADCLGDLGMFSPTWSHMKDLYPDHIREAGLQDVWKKAPVAFETCGDMRDWARRDYDADEIYDWALQQHASFINNKSAPLPEGARPAVEKMLRRLGYRFVLRELSHDAAVTPGGRLAVSTRWENVGVAPCYADYAPAVALVDADGRQVWSAAMDATTRDWLPGKFAVNDTFRLPDDLAPGDYSVQVAIVEKGGMKPVVRLANKGRLDSGWYGFSRLEARRAEGG
jgi:hypothetical protein